MAGSNLLTRRSFVALAASLVPGYKLGSLSSVALTRQKANEFQWDFTDEQGRKWIGSEVVEPSMEEQSKFVLTVRLDRAR